jgi:hypothetical protein
MKPVYETLTGDPTVDLEGYIAVRAGKSFGDGAIVQVEGVTYSQPYDAEMVDRRMKKLASHLRVRGYKVEPYRENGLFYIDDQPYFGIIVKLVRAEEKLRPSYRGFVVEDYPEDGTIVAAGPLIRGENTLPHRVVLRRTKGAAYVVQVQAIPDGDGPGFRPSYCEGRYFMRQEDRPRAMKCFFEKVIAADEAAFPELYDGAIYA